MSDFLSGRAGLRSPGAREGDDRPQRRKWPEASVTLTETMKLAPRLAGAVRAQFTPPRPGERSPRPRDRGLKAKVTDL